MGHSLTFLPAMLSHSPPFSQTDYGFKGGDGLEQRIGVAECHFVPFLQSFNALPLLAPLLASLKMQIAAVSVLF